MTHLNFGRELLTNTKILLLVAMISFVISMLLGEVTIRALFGAPIAWREPQIKHELSSYGYRMVPNQEAFSGNSEVHVNSYGFRGAEWNLNSPHKKILLLGDSITFGAQVAEADTFASKLSARFIRDEIPADVLNGSTLGWSTFHQLDFLKENIALLRPKIVVVNFFYNDFNIREVAQRKIIIEAGNLDGRPAWLKWLPYDGIYFLKRAASISLLRNVAGEIAYMWRNDADAIFFKALFAETLDLKHDQVVTSTLEYLKEIAQLCAAWHASLLITHIPARAITVGPPRKVSFADILKGAVPETAILDMTETFRGARGRKLYLFPWDNHLSPEGHALVAQELYGPLRTAVTASSLSD